MFNKRRIFFIISSFLIPFFITWQISLKNVFENNWLNAATVVFSFILAVLSGVFYKKNKITSCKFALFCHFILFAFVCIYILLKQYNLLEVLSSIASLRDFILSTGSYGMIFYVAIQFLQVMFLPIPSMIINLAGVAIYGPILGSLLCIVGVLSASYTSFFMGKVFGKRVVKWLIGQSMLDKYANLLNEKGKFFLIIAFLLPLFPDDVLCLIAGITTMKFKTFFIISSTTRPIGIIFMSFFGGGYIIPFKGWGLYVWPFLLIFIIFTVIYVYKYQSELEDKILRLIKKRNI